MYEVNGGVFAAVDFVRISTGSPINTAKHPSLSAQQAVAMADE